MLLFFIIQLSAFENSIGRVPKDSLSEQTIMEIFIDGIENKEVIFHREPEQDGVFERILRLFGWCNITFGEDTVWYRMIRFLTQWSWMGSEPDTHEYEPVEIDEWRGVEITTQRSTFEEDGNGRRVTRIDWDEYGLEGTINLEWLPEQVSWLSLIKNKLTGTINLTCLPEAIRHIVIARNIFTGEIDLCHLPEGMESFAVSYNGLSGTIDLGNLPRHLIRSIFDVNEFSGTVNLSHLPDGLQWLSLTQNHLSGTVHLDKLPAGLITLSIGQNDFSGYTDFSKLPKSLEKLAVSNTQIEGEIIPEEGAVYFVDNSNVQMLVPEGLEMVKWKI